MCYSVHLVLLTYGGARGRREGRADGKGVKHDAQDRFIRAIEKN